MAVVLVGIGAFVYGHTRADLDRQIDRELAARMAGTLAIIRDDGDDLGDPVQDPLDRVDNAGYVQVFGPGVELVDGTNQTLRTAPLLDAARVRSLIDAGASVDIDSSLGALRVIAEQSHDDRIRYAVLVGASLDERNQALATLRRLLFIGGPLALMLSSLAAYGVATAALRPVEVMRSRAAEISDTEIDKRLPVGGAGDELDRLSSTLNGMLGRLQAAIERERRFVADASHELRTPLAILKTEIELALAAGRRPEELRAALHSSAEEVNRLSRLATDLLLLAKLDQGRLPISREEFELLPLLERLAHGFAARWEGRSIELRVPEGTRVYGDAMRIEQALSNLIENALRHGAGAVTVSARGEEGKVEIGVRDRGPGFSVEMRGRATERFARTDPPGDGGGDGEGDGGRAGSGLGLAIVASIATAHGGDLLFDGSPEGSTVVLCIPSRGGSKSLTDL